MKTLLTILFLFVWFAGHSQHQQFFQQFNQNSTPSQGVYYVSKSGNDNNNGLSPETAWKTITKVNFHSFLPGDKILFNRGDYWENTLVITSSGNANNDITYDAYGKGEKPLIYGSKIITGWTVYSGNIYKANFAHNINQLFLDDLRVLPARSPNVSDPLHKITKVNSTTQFESTDLNLSIDYTGVQFHIRLNDWRIDQKEIVASNGHTLTIDSELGYDGLEEGKEFFLVDHLDFLDEPGEWYSDGTTVYLWTPEGDSPANHTVRGSVFNRGIIVNNISYVTVRNFKVEQQKKEGVYGNGVLHTTIDKIDVKYPEEYGIRISSHFHPVIAIRNIVLQQPLTDEHSFNTVSNNTVDRINYLGISVSGGGALITDNMVSNIGLFEELGINGIAGKAMSPYGMSIGDHNNIVQYNRLINLGYLGISWVGNHTIIKNNFIDSTCLTVQDGGAIYTYSKVVDNDLVLGSVIEGNIILHAGDNAIYGDNNTNNVEIKNNTVAYGVKAAVFYHDNYEMNAHHNTFFHNSRGVRSSGPLGVIPTGKGQNDFDNNIVIGYDTGETSLNSSLMGLQHSGKTPRTMTGDNNTYINHYYTNPFGDLNGYLVRSFSGWKTNMLMDINSTFDNSPLAEGETEQLFYNDSKETKSINLGGFVHKDIYGNRVSSTLTLEPFTSKILIKTDETINRTLVINAQSFNIQDIKQMYDFIGQVIARYPDGGQTLTYSITGGNTENLFYIDPTTGEIFANETIHFENDTYYDLIVEVSDDAPTALSASATVTINITGINIPDPPPQITFSFSIPALSTSLTVDVTVSLSNSDKEQIAGYLVTETSAVPSMNNPGWSNTAPTTFTFSDYGINTLYGWVKDRKGNIFGGDAFTTMIIDISPVYTSECISIFNGKSYQGSKVLKGELLYKKHESIFAKSNTTTNLPPFNTFGIDMYPNPAKNYVTIRFSELPLTGTEIIVTDITGKDLIHQKALSNNEILDIHSFPSGMYFVKTKFEKSYKIFKLIKN